MKARSACILFFGLLFFASCTEEPSPPTPVEMILKAEEGGHFRGNTIGDNIQEVLARESTNIVHNMPDEITCRIPLDIKKSTFYEITYNFNEQGLYVIEMDIFPKTTKDTKELFDSFKGFYDTRYGKSTVDDGYTTWLTKSSQGTDIEISMIDKTRELQKPYLSVIFYEYSLND